jgi:hypothetical protein
MDVNPTPHPETVEPAAPIKRGAICPLCAAGRLDYNGVLDLDCPKCAFAPMGIIKER